MQKSYINRCVNSLNRMMKLRIMPQTYSKMKPKEAAAIFDSMTDNLSLVAKILNAMDAQSRGNILGKMDSATAAKVTKIMNPSQN